MSIPSLHLLPASHQQPSLCFETGGRTHSFMSLNLSGPYKTQRPKLGHHWPTLAKPCRFLSGGGTPADHRHPQLPCAGGQEAFLLHHARWSMGTGLFVYIGYTGTSDFLSICCCCPKMLHTRSPTAYRPITSKLVGFKCLCSYSSRYRPAEPRAFLLLLSSLTCTHQPYWGGAGETPVMVKTPRGPDQSTSVTFGTSHPDMTHKTPHYIHLQDPSSGGR